MAKLIDKLELRLDFDRIYVKMDLITMGKEGGHLDRTASCCPYIRTCIGCVRSSLVVSHADRREGRYACFPIDSGRIGTGIHSFAPRRPCPFPAEASRASSAYYYLFASMLHFVERYSHPYPLGTFCPPCTAAPQAAVFASPQVYFQICKRLIPQSRNFSV